MGLIVQKFGGSSMADIKRIRNVAEIIAETRAGGDEVIAVVSAMFGETDRLIRLAEVFSCSGLSEYDALVSTGEQVSASLLSMALNQMGCPACSYTGAQVKILTDLKHKNARITDIETSALRAEMAAGRVPVVAGFQGVTEAGRVTTLGRGGSDLTAVALAAIFEADECQIFTDVDGVYTSDPKIVPSARRHAKINFEEMMELSSLGAKVLQKRSLNYAGKYKVPVRVLSSLHQDGGTLIDYGESALGRSSISGVAFDRLQAKITLQGVEKRPGLASYLLGPISKANIEVDMIVQNTTEYDSKIDFSFTLHRDDFKEAMSIASEVTKELPCKLLGDDSVAKLSLVGVGMRSHAGVASKMFSALGQEGIDIHLITTSELKISAVIDENYLDLGARTLHSAFNLSD